MIQVFKFGGASVQDASSVKNVCTILSDEKTKSTLVVISAAGKTTNALEAVFNAYWEQNEAELTIAVEKVKAYHFDLMAALFASEDHSVYAEVNDIFVDLDWILEESPEDSYGYLYDQIVSIGELLSTQIVSAYLNDQGLINNWLDVRDCIQTNNEYKNASVDWPLTEQNIKKTVPNLLKKGFVVTQGFIGGTSENFTTTLGREGSDFSAAIFAYALDAQSVSVWKDVPGVLNADPRRFENTTQIFKIDYEEAIEMTYYGAQVIHPKTIRPLQNKQIPLIVRSFENREAAPTEIGTFDAVKYPPVIVIKEQQSLLQITSKDLYFIDESKFAQLFEAMAKAKVKVNLIQNTALAFSACIDNNAEGVAELEALIAEQYEVQRTDALQLLTLRYATTEMLQQVQKNNKIYLQEQISQTAQFVLSKNAKIPVL